MKLFGKEDPRPDAGPGPGPGPDISVVIPCFNEDAALPALFARLPTAAATWNRSWEAICVDDGSTDGTWERIVGMAQADPHWRGVSLSRNFGHQAAVSAGMFHSRGRAVVIIDGDLQDPPEEIHRLIQSWQAGYEIVNARRRNRKESYLKNLCALAYYRLVRSTAGIDVTLDSGDFCLMDRRAVDLVNELPERNRYVRGLRAWIGFRQTTIAYERPPRVAGEGKYGYWKLLRLALDGIYSITDIPGRVIGFLAVMMLVAAAAAGMSAHWTAATPADATLTSASSSATVTFFVAASVLAALAFVTGYLRRILDEVRGRPRWIVARCVGFDENETPAAEPAARSTTRERTFAAEWAARPARRS